MVFYDASIRVHRHYTGPRSLDYLAQIIMKEDLDKSKLHSAYYDAYVLKNLYGKI
jgi:DNA polymerase III epsilon subunit-like protein